MYLGLNENNRIADDRNIMSVRKQYFHSKINNVLNFTQIIKGSVPAVTMTCKAMQ